MKKTPATQRWKNYPHDRLLSDNSTNVLITRGYDGGRFVDLHFRSRWMNYHISFTIDKNSMDEFLLGTNLQYIEDDGDKFMRVRKIDDCNWIMAEIFDACAGDHGRYQGQCVTVVVPFRAWDSIVQGADDRILARTDMLSQAEINMEGARLDRFTGKEGHRLLKKAYKTMSVHFVTRHGREKYGVFADWGKDFYYVCENRDGFRFNGGIVCHENMRDDGHFETKYENHT